jgi:hypothetical protein
LSENRSRGKKLLQSLKSFFIGWTPCKIGILLKQLGYSVSYFGEIRNEALIVTGKTKKLTDLMH